MSWVFIHVYPSWVCQKMEDNNPFFCHVDGINHDQPSAFGGPIWGPMFRGTGETLDAWLDG